MRVAIMTSAHGDASRPLVAIFDLRDALGMMPSSWGIPSQVIIAQLREITEDCLEPRWCVLRPVPHDCASVPM